jgi:hypothetical protein
MKTWSTRLSCLLFILLIVGNAFCGLNELLNPLCRYKGEEARYFYYKKYTEVTLKVELASKAIYEYQEYAMIPLAYTYSISTKGKAIQSVLIDSIVVINKQDSVVFVSRNINFEYPKKNKKKMVFSYQNYDNPDSTMKLLYIPSNPKSYIYTSMYRAIYISKNNDYTFRFIGKYQTGENTYDPFVEEVKVNLSFYKK